MPSLLAYVLLFTGISAFFIFSHLMLGRLVRPNRPDAEKKTIYECGEPTIGSSWIQFDLRFYVVALLFVVFDVEMAFFFPWAVVFGKANELSGDLPNSARVTANQELLPEHAGKLNEFSQQQRKRFNDLLQIENPEEADLATIGRLVNLDGDQKTDVTKARQALVQAREKEIKANQASAGSLALTGFLDIVVFFGVLLVGFAYLWRRGDLDWVRSVAGQRSLEEAEAADETEARNLLAVK